MVAAFVCAPHSRASELRQFDVLVIPHTGTEGLIPEVSPTRVHATFDEHKVSVVAVQQARPILGKHTVVLLDFEHASAKFHTSMIMETLHAVAEVGDPEITVIAAGESRRNLEIFDLADNGKIGLLLPPPRLADGHDPQQVKDSARMYWQTWPGLDLIGTVANWFDATDSPVRVVWISEDFTWALPRHGLVPMSDDVANFTWTHRPCDPGDMGCQAMKCLAASSLNIFWGHPYVVRLSEAGITLFPLIIRGGGAQRSRADQQKNQRAAEYVAKHTGGFTLFADTLGDGKALTRALRTTSAGYVVRLSGTVQQGSLACPYPLRISIDGPPHIRFTRDFTISAEGQIRRQTDNHFCRLVPAFHKLAADFSCGDKASGESGLKITVPEAIKSAPPGKFYVHVTYNAGPVQRFVFNRRQLSTGEAAQCLCAPLLGRPEAVRLVSAYDEATKWAQKLDDSN